MLVFLALAALIIHAWAQHYFPAQLLDRDIVRWTEVIQRAGIAQQ